MGKIISGIQQVGIGIPDVHHAWKWYRDSFAIDVPIFEEAAEANLMLPYTGGEPQQRHAILALSMQGGGGLEIWQYTSRKPQPASFNWNVGDYGIEVCSIKARDIRAAHQRISTENRTSDISTDPSGKNQFFTQDPYGNWFQVIESDSWFSNTGEPTGGVGGCIIGVSNMEDSLKLYNDILGYDEVVYDVKTDIADWSPLPNDGGKYRRVKLSHAALRQGGFSQLLGKTTIELVQCLEGGRKKIYDQRFWGDLGFIHLCFDVVGMADLKEECAAAGFPFTVDSSNSFDMGEAAGHFSYIEDPDGTLIEFVETHKIPIMKKWNWYLDMRKRDPSKPLPKWMLKSLRFNRKKK